MPIKHDYTCENCGKPATRSMEQVWAEYPIDNEGNFGKGGITGDEQIAIYYYCDEHES